MTTEVNELGLFATSIARKRRKCQTRISSRLTKSNGKDDNIIKTNTEPPNKRPVGRARKTLSIEQINCMMEKYHDYNELKEWCELSEIKIADFYLHSGKMNSNETEHKTRRRYTEKTKDDIREHYIQSKNYAATAREFGINESTVRTIVKTPARNCKMNDKGNRPGGGRPLTYPLEAEDEILSWLLELQDFHLPISILALQEKAKCIIRPYNPAFNASRGWVEKLFARHRLSLLSKTSISHKLPKRLEESVTKFHEEAERFMRVGKYPRSLIGNMDEAPILFDTITPKSLSKTGSRECVVRTSVSEKNNVTIVLSAAADGTVLPPMLIFKGKTDKIIKNLLIPEGFIVKVQETTLMDGGLMQEWLEEIWLKYVKDVSQQLGFDKSLLTFDKFPAHETGNVLRKLAENKTDILMIPPGCTAKCQPMNVCIDKPFIAILRTFWANHVTKIVGKNPETQLNDCKVLPPPTRQDIVDWVEEAYKWISSDKDMVIQSFDVCGITSSDPAKVRSESFYDKCMHKANEIIVADQLDNENGLVV